MSEVDITTNFKISAEYNIIFCVCVNNRGTNNISNVEVILNRTNPHFNPIGEDRQFFNSILPGQNCTSEFIVQCPKKIDNVGVGAYVIYYNQKGKKCFASILPQKINLYRQKDESTVS